MLSSYKKGQRYHYTYSIPDFWYDYRDKYDGTYQKKEFSDTLVRFVEMLRHEIVVNRYVFQFPGLGRIRIKKVKPTGSLGQYRVDHVKSKKLNIRVYHLNLHTNRCYFKWNWDKAIRTEFSMTDNDRFYFFKPVRQATRFLAKHILDCARNPEVMDYDVLPDLNDSYKARNTHG